MLIETGEWHVETDIIPNFMWLESNHEWIRAYTYHGHVVCIRPNKENWWMMEYSWDTWNWKIYHNIICADALKYHYRYDNKHPQSVSFEWQGDKVFQGFVVNNQVIDTFFDNVKRIVNRFGIPTLTRITL